MYELYKIVHDLFLFFDDSEAIEMSEGAVTNDVDAKEADGIVA